jgi:hypothetical protein
MNVNSRAKTKINSIFDDDDVDDDDSSKDFSCSSLLAVDES